MMIEGVNHKTLKKADKMENLKIENLAKKIEANQYVPETYAARADGSVDFSKLVKCPLNLEECTLVAKEFFRLLKTESKAVAFENSIGFTIKPQTDISFQPRTHIKNFK